MPGRYPTFALAQNEPRVVRYWMRVENTRLDFAAPAIAVDRIEQRGSVHARIVGIEFGKSPGAFVEFIETFHQVFGR